MNCLDSFAATLCCPQFSQSLAPLPIPSERTLMPPRGGVNRRDGQIKPFFLKNLSLTSQGG
jgi:hypothetical protein